MKFFMHRHGWSCGAFLVPEGTTLDRTDWTIHGMPLPWPPPPNALALDQEAYDEMLRYYPHYVIMTADPAINRHGDPQTRRRR